MNYYLGVDVGHTRIKSAIFDVTGKEISAASQETPFTSDIIDAGVLWKCVSVCLRKVITESNIRASEIKCVTCSGHGNGIYALDKEGNPLKRAYAATYGASNGVANYLVESGKAETVKKYTLQDTWAGQPLTILAHLKSEDIDLYKSIKTAFFCKDYINYCLTGSISTDYTDASAAGIINNRTGRYDDQIFEILDLIDKQSVFPPLKKSYEIVGYVSKSAAENTGLLEGTPVTGGMFDVAASLIGSGVYKPNICGVISGTWGINSIISDVLPRNQRFLQCTRFVDGASFIYTESAPTSSVNLEWLLKKIFVGINYKEADMIVEKYTASDVNIVYSPYICGDIRNGGGGAFNNISAYDTFETMLRAVYEGVAFGHRKQLERLTESGAVYDKIVFSGGTANSDIWCRIFSDVLNHTLYVPKSSNVGALGDVIIGGLAVGEFDSIEHACDVVMPEYRVYNPDKNAVAVYNEKYRFFKQYTERQR